MSSYIFSFVSVQEYVRALGRLAAWVGGKGRGDGTTRRGWAGATDDTKRIDMVRNLKYVIYSCLII